MARSPGVNSNEIDRSTIETGTPQVGAILVGRTPTGPAFKPITLSREADLIAIFGDRQPDCPVTYAGQNYLKNSSALTVVRILGHKDGTTVNNGYVVSNVVGISDTAPAIGSTGSILAVIHVSGAFPATQVSGVAGDSSRFIFKVGTSFAATASFLTSSDDYIGKVLNTDPTRYGPAGHYLHQVFPYSKPAVSASWSVVNSTVQAGTSFLRDFEHATTAWIKSQPLGGIEYDLFRFHTVADGSSANANIKVQIANVRPSTLGPSQPFGTFDVIVRRFDDSDVRPVELQRFASLTLDPDSPNYIALRIGDQIEEFDTATRKFVVRSGAYVRNSPHIFVEINPNLSAPPQALPFGFRGYSKQLFSGSNVGNGGANGLALIPSLSYVPDQLDLNGFYNPNIGWGVSFVSGGVADRMKALPDLVLSSFATGSDVDFSLSNISGSYVNGALRYSYRAGWGQYSPIVVSASLQSFTMPFGGGFDGWDARVADPLYLNNNDSDTVIGVVSSLRAIDSIANPDQIAGNVLAIPGQHNIRITDYARELVNDRRDMFYVMDITGSTRAEAIASLEARQIDDSYTAAYYPDLLVTDPKTKRIVRVPPSVAVLGALAFNDKVAQPFFAPAGMNRGGLSQFNVTDTVDRLNTPDRDALYEARINPITRLVNQGIVVFGQKTLLQKPSALDRVNVRRLLIMAKRLVALVAQELLFEQNNSSTWTRFVNKVNPILDGIARGQGISRFKVVMDSTTNTSDIIEQNQMLGKIFLEPTRSGEFITVDFIIAASGVSFGS